VTTAAARFQPEVPEAPPGLIPGQRAIGKRCGHVLDSKGMEFNADMTKLFTHCHFCGERVTGRWQDGFSTQRPASSR
jgi:hypothetical protein